MLSKSLYGAWSESYVKKGMVWSTTIQEQWSIDFVFATKWACDWHYIGALAYLTPRVLVGWIGARLNDGQCMQYDLKCYIIDNN